MPGRRWIALGGSSMVVTAAIWLGLTGSSAANAGQTNNQGGSTVGTVVPDGSAASGTHSYTVAASAFAPDGLRTTTNDYFNNWDPSNLSNQDVQRCFNAGAYLPNGARIVSVTIYYTEGSNPMYFEINRQALATGSSVIVVNTETVATTGPPFYTHTTLAVTANNVVNTKDAYSFGVCPTGTTGFSGATITYTG